MSLEHAAALHERGDLERAEAGYRGVLSKDPGCHQALHGLGLIQYQYGHYEIAVKLIEQALKTGADQADYHYHLGEILREAGRYSDALVSYRQALRLNGTEGDYYFGLGKTLSETGDLDGCIGAYRKAVRYAPEDAEIHNNLGNVLAERNDVDGALVHLRKAVALAPDYADAHHNLSLVLHDSDSPRDALRHAERACRLAPDRVDPLINCGRLLIESGNRPGGMACYQRALDLARADARHLARVADSLSRVGEPRVALAGYRQAVSLDPDAVRYRLGVASSLIRLQRFDEAMAESEKTLELDSDCAPAYHNLAVCLQTRGDFERAIALLRRALELQPSLTSAAYLLASNGAYRVSDVELDQWRALREEAGLGDEDRYHLYFSLAKVYERRGRYGAAFENYRQANRIKARCFPFDAERHAAYVNRLMTVFDRQFFADRSDFGLRDARMVFIVGMPRSGSTLAEQVLASHPQVQAIGEHPEMREIVRDLPRFLDSDQPVPDCYGELDRERAQQLAQRYLGSLPEEGGKYAERICDKMLGNFMRLGIIALLFPHARVVHTTRNPLDTCLSCYTQDFAQGLRFTTDLSTLAVFYQSYRALMDHWTRTLPLAIHEVNYETLVRDPEPVIRGLIDFCDLSWDDRCLSPHRAKREVATASVWQARQPIYRNAVNRWRHYEAFLAPLVESLENGGITVGATR